MYGDTTPGAQPTVRLLGYSDLESAYDDPDRVGALAGRIDKLRDDATLVAGAGDDTALGVLALLTDAGRAQARPFFERVAPAVETFGNHDFDPGREWAYEWAGSVPPTYLCANLAGPGSDRVPDGTVLERGGARVGVVGLAHPETADICGAVEGLRVSNPVSAARAAFDDLGPVDYRVVLAHCGAADPEVAAGVDADVVLGGHRHDRRHEHVEGTLLVRTPGSGTELVEVALGPTGGDDPTAMATFHEIAPDEDPQDATLADVYRERRERLGVDETVAHVDRSLPRTERERFGGESRLGNFAADAFRAAAGADAALFPAGSLRTGPPLSGDVTRAEVVSLCPFDSPVVECVLDGAALRAVLAEAAHPHPGDRGWVHFHTSGLRARWTDANELAGATVDGDPLDDDRTYRVATAEYVVVIDAFGPVDRDAVAAEHDRQWQTLLAHAREGGLDVAREGRIERVPAPEAADGLDG